MLRTITICTIIILAACWGFSQKLLPPERKVPTRFGEALHSNMPDFRLELCSKTDLMTRLNQKEVSLIRYGRSEIDLLRAKEYPTVGKVLARYGGHGWGNFNSPQIRVIKANSILQTHSGSYAEDEDEKRIYLDMNDVKLSPGDIVIFTLSD